MNDDSLLHDMAKGEGTYLMAFSHVPAVPSAKEQIFRDRLQQGYPRLASIHVRKGKEHGRECLTELASLSAQAHPKSQK